MALEFVKSNSPKTCSAFAEALQGIDVKCERHAQFKRRVPHAIDLIRTGDTVQYANIILESA